MRALAQRYSRNSKLSKLPRWITQYLDPAHKTLSVLDAVAVARDFLKQLAQPRVRVWRSQPLCWYGRALSALCSRRMSVSPCLPRSRRSSEQPMQ